MPCALVKSNAAKRTANRGGRPRHGNAERDRGRPKVRARVDSKRMAERSYIASAILLLRWERSRLSCPFSSPKFRQEIRPYF